MPRERREGPWHERRDNGIFYAYWYDVRAKRVRSCSLHTSDPVEANVAFGQFLINGRVIYEAGTETVSVEGCLDFYLQDYVDHRCADPARQRHAAAHLKEFFRDTLVEDVDVAMCRKYAAARRRGDIGGGERRKTAEARAGSDATIRRELNVLVAAANHAVKHKRLKADKLPIVELPQVVTAEVEWLTQEEVKALIEVTDGDLRHFIRIAYMTAARRRAVQNLTAEQVDFRRGVINLAADGEVVTVKRKAVVPLYDEIRGDLEALVARAPRGRLFGGADMYRPYREAAEGLGYHGRAHPHVLRHSRATHLLMRGVSIYDVAKLLGDSVQTVERRYGHSSPAHLASTTGGL